MPFLHGARGIPDLDVVFVALDFVRVNIPGRKVTGSWWFAELVADELRVDVMVGMYENIEGARVVGLLTSLLTSSMPDRHLGCW